VFLKVELPTRGSTQHTAAQRSTQPQGSHSLHMRTQNTAQRPAHRTQCAHNFSQHSTQHIAQQITYNTQHTTSSFANAQLKDVFRSCPVNQLDCLLLPYMSDHLLLTGFYRPLCCWWRCTTSDDLFPPLHTLQNIAASELAASYSFGPYLTKGRCRLTSRCSRRPAPCGPLRPRRPPRHRHDHCTLRWRCRGSQSADPFSAPSSHHGRAGAGACSTSEGCSSCRPSLALRLGGS
jgi:hypothetical protein